MRLRAGHYRTWRGKPAQHILLCPRQALRDSSAPASPSLLPCDPEGEGRRRRSRTPPASRPSRRDERAEGVDDGQAGSGRPAGARENGPPLDSRRDPSFPEGRADGASTGVGGHGIAIVTVGGLNGAGRELLLASSTLFGKNSGLFGNTPGITCHQLSLLLSNVVTRKHCLSSRSIDILGVSGAFTWASSASVPKHGMLYVVVIEGAQS
jgi:hypothetical protein